MRIFVLVKQVPGTNQVEVDPETGVLKRSGIESKLNPYDLYAVETALRIRERMEGSHITALSLGPPQAEAAVRETFLMGTDAGFLVSDRHFAGSDVLATSRALAQSILSIGMPDLIICGKQTTDGDTAQVGSEIAEFLGIPHICGVLSIEDLSDTSISVRYDLTDTVDTAKVPFPCLISVDKGIFQPRLPSYLLGKKTASKKVERIGLSDFSESDPALYGLEGSPTHVKRIFPPEHSSPHETWKGTPDETADTLYAFLADGKYFEGDRP